jgi:hypothetical protein
MKYMFWIDFHCFVAPFDVDSDMRRRVVWLQRCMRMEVLAGRQGKLGTHQTLQTTFVEAGGRFMFQAD